MRKQKQFVLLSLFLVTGLLLNPVQAASSDNLKKCPDPSVHQNNTDHNDVRFSVGHPVEVWHANPISMFFWAASVYIKEDPYIPLFGYFVSGTPAPTISDAVVATTEADVRIVILTRRKNGSDSESDDIFKGQGVQIASGIDEGKLRDEWECFLQNATMQHDDIMIAFTRPLLDREAEKEFVATSQLWAPPEMTK